MVLLAGVRNAQVGEYDDHDDDKEYRQHHREEAVLFELEMFEEIFHIWRFVFHCNTAENPLKRQK